jgi:FixJ family two-component response regulator
MSEDSDTTGATMTDIVRARRATRFAKSNSKTAENHRTNLMRKLGVHDVAGVIRFVIRQGLYDSNGEG